MSESRLGGAAIRQFAGCQLSPLDSTAFFERIVWRLEAGERSLLIGHHNLHSVYLFHHRLDVADFYRRCDDCYIDGVGMLWLLRSAGVDTRSAHRFTLMECLPQLLDLARDRGLRIFYLGGSREAVRRAENWVAADWPELEIQFHHGFFEDTAAVVDCINRIEPDFLLVGMGMPVQERWILANRKSLSAGAIFQAGGTLDYYTGLQARPPARWSRFGMAWLYRLIHDPRRLWHRYLVTPWSLLLPALRLRRSLRSRRG
ncbi:MAG: WecB/TagA/CpsF family glycosyltransferase [Xanthomonadales bacterium]|nr:WecB/TagA/CpsF family glycosyltransferase [Xanthomonadales bacterium]